MANYKYLRKNNSFMDDRIKLRIAVLFSIVGIALLFVLSKFITIEPIKITDIDGTFVGKTVFINGTITKATISERTIFYVDNSSIPLIIFSKVDLFKNTDVLITGRVDEYNDGIQIVVDKIEIV
jgi:hypothetical protein